MRRAYFSPSFALSTAPMLGFWMLWTLPTPIPFSANGQIAVARAVSAPRELKRQRKSEAGRLLYQMRCARCHETDGKGGDLHETNPHAPDFTDLRWQQSRSVHALVVTIQDGKGTQMPAFGGRLSDAEVRDVVAYIRSFAPTSPTAAESSPDDFEARFRELEEEFERLREQIDKLRAERKR
jgi:mono/diheme cytochrome c family protein